MSEIKKIRPNAETFCLRVLGIVAKDIEAGFITDEEGEKCVDTIMDSFNHG